MTSTRTAPAPARPEISVIMPAYNEEGLVAASARKTADAFVRAGHRVELIVVNNGSSDRTGEVIEELAAEVPAIRCHHVDENQGYGHGILNALQFCTAPWVGIIHADGQVDPEDLVRLYELAVASRGSVIAKVHRRFRMDGLRRRIVSTAYNLFVFTLWPRIGSSDINGSPKILRRQVLQDMALTSKDWLLDPEIMVKAHYLQLRVLELNVLSRARSCGLSHVRVQTCWTFLWQLILVRLSSKWRRDVTASMLAAQQPAR